MRDAEGSEFAIDREALARAYDRAGDGYDAASPLAPRWRGELLERLQFFALDARVILDLGAGTCAASALLQRRYPSAHLLAVDIAPGMLSAARRAWRPGRRYARVCADAHRLPLRAASVDLVYSSLMLQWRDPLLPLFAEVARVLRPGGLLLFSAFGPETLMELRVAWSAVDGGAHVAAFPDLPQLGEVLMRSGFAEPVLDIEQYRLHQPDARALMRELQRCGARNVAHARTRGLTTPRKLQRVIDAYEGAREPKGLPVTCEVIFGAAFAAPTGHHEHAQSPTEQVVSVSTLKRHDRRWSRYFDTISAQIAIGSPTTGGAESPLIHACFHR